MQPPQIGARSARIMRELAGPLADIYVARTMRPSLRGALKAETDSLADLKAAFFDPYRCLRALYAYYAFARRGKERMELASLVVQAFEDTCSPERFDDFVERQEGAAVWLRFAALCEERRRKSHEQLNKGTICGLAELALEIGRELPGESIAGWIVREVTSSGRLDPTFTRMVEIRGVGPKLTSLFMRDVVFVNGIEHLVDPVDRLYTQPIDRWSRLLAPYIIPEEGIGDAADWVLAGKLAKYARQAKFSGIRLSMGMTAFGVHSLRGDVPVSESLEALISA